MLKTIRRRNARSLAKSNRTWLGEHLDNIARLVDEIRALPEGASALELAVRLVAEAEDAELRALYVDELAAKANR